MNTSIPSWLSTGQANTAKGLYSDRAIDGVNYLYNIAKDQE